MGSHAERSGYPSRVGGTMATDLGPAWLALAGGLFGAGAGYLGTRATLKASAAEAAKEREEARDLARLTYAVETLLELQIVVHRTIRLCGRILNWHRESEGLTNAERSTTEFLKAATELQRKVLAADAAIILLASRIEDEPVRLDSSSGRIAMLMLLRAPDFKEAAPLWEEARTHLNRAQERIGSLLRDLPPPMVFRPVVSEMWSDDLDL